jgi:spore coat protein A
MNARTALLLVTLTLLVSGRARAQTFVAVKDNTLYQESGQLSNGAGDHLFAGRTNSTNVPRRGLVAFDLTSIPPGSLVTSVSLQLYMSRSKAQTKNVGLHLALADWGEGTSHAAGEEGQGAPATTGDATWTHRFYPTVPWTNPGGDFAPVATATTAVNKEAFYTWSTAQMVLDVQAWVDDPATNFGWFLVGEENGQRTTKRFDSHSNSSVSQRPRLTVTYNGPSLTGACCLPDGSCVTTTSGSCTSQGGIYQGNNTICAPNPCPQPVGACCFDDGSCSQLTSADCAAQGGTWLGGGSACSPNPCPVVLQPYVDALPIPGVAQPVAGTPGGAADYVIAMTEFQQRLHRDLPPTTVWGYGGSYPGPTIEAGTGLPVTVTWLNDLRDSSGNLRTSHYLPVDTCLHGPDMEGDSPRTVVHLHGGHVEAEFDGYPEDTFLPGESVLYMYSNFQPPATLWYHDHALGITRLNVMMGLAGFYLVRDALEQGLGLPSGPYEIPLVVQDRTFNSDGTWKYPASWEEHFFGDTILVNGKVWPYLRVARGKYRFRLLNGSNSRTYTFTLSNGASFQQIGTDGGLLPAPVGLNVLTLSPGERADLVVDFASYAPGTEIRLVNSAPAPYPGTPGVGVVPDVMKFVVTSAGGHTDPIPTSLRPVVPLDEADATEFRTLRLEKSSNPCSGSIWLIDGLGFDVVTERPALGDTEVWGFANNSGTVHPMHLHLVQFQVLDRQDFVVVAGQILPSGPRIPPAPNERGWKDTVQAPPMQITRVITRFEDYTGLYPYHCHVLEHEDNEMMRQFEVVLRKTKLAPTPPADGGTKSVP